MKKVSLKKFGLIIIALTLILFVALFIPVCLNGAGITPTVAEAESYTKDTNINYDRVKKVITVKDKKVLDVVEFITVTFKQSNVNVGLTRNISHANKITRIVNGKRYVKKTVNNLLSYSVYLRKAGGEYRKEYSFTQTDEDYFYILTGADGDYKDAGTYTYRIGYQYDMGEDFINAFDDFTFDVMDYGFRSPVDRFEAIITLPFEFLDGKKISDVLSFRTNEMSALTFEDVHAAYDAENLKITCSYENLGTPSGASEGKGLTMQLILPQGYFHTSYEPTALYKVALAFCIISVVGITAVILGVRYRKKPVIVTEFTPPDNLSPLDVARIYRGKLLGKDFASLVIHWASMGLLKIEFNGKRHVILTKLKDYPRAGRLTTDEPKELPSDSSAEIYINEDFDGVPSKSAPERGNNEFRETETKPYPTRFTKYERDYFNAIFSTSEKYDSKKERFGYRNYPRSRRIGKAVSDLKETEHRQKVKSAIAKVIITIFSTLPLLFLGIWSSGGVGGGLPILFIMLFPLIGLNVFLYVPMPLWFKLLWCSLFGGMPFAFLITQMYTVYDVWYLSIIASIIFFCGHLSGLFIRVYPKEGEEKLGKILGFKDFLLYAELDKLNEMVESNPDYYYNVLPYCYVFGITKKMQKRFNSISAHARLPEYFDGYTSTAVCHHLTSSMGHIGGGFSSSGGGGGSSGGGGGGGGGSSGGGGGGGGCGGR